MVPPEPSSHLASLTVGQRSCPAGETDTLYRYRSGPADTATRQYATLAKRYGMSMTELALRWGRERTSVTTALLGHTSMAQLDETLKFYQAKEPLPRDLSWEIGALTRERVSRRMIGTQGARSRPSLFAWAS